MAKSQEICTDCGSRQPAVLRNRGYGWIEVLCWLALVLPGIFYSIWRRARRRWVCAYCGNPSMVSIHSERARKITALTQTKEIPEALFKKEMGVTELKPPKRKGKRKIELSSPKPPSGKKTAR